MESDLKCPRCGESEFQELSYRYCWQPVALDARTLADGPEDYGSFDYGDDAFVVGVLCTSCDTTWSSYDDLAKALAGEAHATGELEPIWPQPEAPVA